ncbi:uncharacterized protein [Lepeophtheirus salmonis]|uniref:Eagle [Tribolium castaneum] n=1 Tax=Lepeophtheirus salmonis TaxID=72036 RepID=A0A0K2U8L2_LEPSM|nr:protein embryonic gonad-like [Lepeophtheirus salmonis]
MMISDSGSIDAMLRSASNFNSHFGGTGGVPPTNPSIGNQLEQPPKFEAMDPMQNQLCRVCEEPAAGFHFGAFTCEGCKSFFGRTCNNQSVIQECKNNYRCVVDKKNRTACKACRLRKCIMVGMSKSGSRYGRRSNWFKIHCLMQQNLGGNNSAAAAAAVAVASRSRPKMSSPKMEKRESPYPLPSPIGHFPHSSMQETDDDIIDVSSSRSPEHSPTLLPPPISSTSSSVTSASLSPFKNLIRPPSPSSSNGSTKSESPIILPHAPPHPLLHSVPPATSSSSTHSPLTPPYPGSFPLSSLMSGFQGIPFHKQPLLSPLLAVHSPLWQVAAAARNPFLNIRPPELDLMAEHKALMERFAAANAVTAAAAAAAAASRASPPSSKSLEDPPPQHIPMDLTKKTPMEIFLSNASKFSSLKADFNRNNLFPDLPESINVKESDGEDEDLEDSK